MAENNCPISDTEVDLGPDVKTIFISGYGSLEASIYRELKSYGTYMCEPIRHACKSKESSEVCTLGKALYN